MCVVCAVCAVCVVRVQRSEANRDPKCKVLLLHGAKGSGVAGLANPRQKKSRTKTRRVMGPLFFQAAAGGQVKGR